VIVSAGGIESPKLLQLSGIGDGEYLRELGIPVISHVPGVGRNLREHLLCFMQWKLRDWGASENRQYSGWRLGFNVLRYLMTKQGYLGEGPYPVGGFFRTRPALERPHAQLMFAAISRDRAAKWLQMESVPGFQMFTYGLRPQSQGWLRISSKDPNQAAEIDPNYLSDPEDQRVAILSMRMMRRLAATRSLGSVIDSETLPGPEVGDSDEELCGVSQACVSWICL
jgi:choline dehydrogenase-like flavoprotein